jgi:hypothetical protein
LPNELHDSEYVSNGNQTPKMGKKAEIFAAVRHRRSRNYQIYICIFLFSDRGTNKTLGTYDAMR